MPCKCYGVDNASANYKKIQQNMKSMMADVAYFTATPVVWLSRPQRLYIEGKSSQFI